MNYELVMQATGRPLSKIKEKGNDIMPSNIITTEERNYLISSMERLLDEYGYTYTDYALNKIIDKWAAQKADLIEAFKKHPNYLAGKFMISFDANYERIVNTEGSKEFARWLDCYVMAQYVSFLPSEIDQQRIREGCSMLPKNLYWFIRDLHKYAERTISETTAETINSMVPEVHAHTGQKTSRVINKLCSYLGYNKHPDYNRKFAQYADSLSPLVIKRHTVLSLNPLDYLTMSFGNSWASCHTIDKNNTRNMPNSYEGQYSSGTMSYMLDPSSMVFYTVDYSYNGDEYWNQPKIIRQMFHWGEEKLVQGRLYPQDNDCNHDAYTPYRNIVQEIMSQIFDFPNLWSLSKGSGAASRYIYSYGTHYRDYYHYDNCSLSRVKGSENECLFNVGADPICIECGNEHDNSENINCCTDIDAGYCCEYCGCCIDEDDVIWVDNEAYCRDCVEYCDCCERYHRGDSTHIEGEDIHVCDSCLDEYYTYCEECHEYVRNRDTRYVESVDSDICDSCLDEYYFRCDECGEYYRTRDIAQYIYEDRELCEDCYNNVTDEDSEAC
jgi:hypothetical protein